MTKLTPQEFDNEIMMFEKRAEVSSATISFIERRQKPITRNIADKFIKQMGLNEPERDEFLKLSIMNNAAIAVKKIHKELLGNNNGKQENI